MKRSLGLVAVAAVAVLPTQLFAQLTAVPFLEPDAAAIAVQPGAEPASYDRAASDEFTQLTAAGECSTTRIRGIDIALSWQVKRSEVQAYRVDVSKVRGGFASGQFLTSGERPAAERGLIFETPEPGIYYYWRLLTRTGEGWIVSGNGRVQTPVCPADKVYE